MHAQTRPVTLMGYKIPLRTLILCILIVGLVGAMTTVLRIESRIPLNVHSGDSTEPNRGDLSATTVLTNSNWTVWLPQIADEQQAVSWRMAGANPQRTSWVPDQVPSAEYLAAHRNEWNNGHLYPQWFKPIEPYIPNKVQIVAAYDTLYVSTARGLYALDAETGTEKWVYPTELPLGHSPTVDQDTVYVGGFDKKIHAINAFTGQRKWTFEATQGFETNPLVVSGMLYAGNRDGYLYAIYVQGPNTGQLAWKYKTDGPILFSAAYQDGTVFFASNDSYAYALDASTGRLVWKSAKLPGAGFHSWWPVVYQNVVIFAGSSNYRDNVRPGASCNCNIDQLDREVYPNDQTDPRGTPVGPRGPDGWIDASRITQYFEAKAWRRTYFVLDRFTGKEVTYDFDRDGRQEYAPILWLGSQSGNRYPPVVGADGIVYQANDYMSAPWINGGGVSGWRIGTPYISTPSSYWHAIDEPMSYAAGGNIIYWAMHSDLAAGAFDISVPNTRFWDSGQPDIDYSREWVYWDYNLNSLLPGYDVAFGGGWNFGGQNGVYGRNGDQNPLIPYKGKVYVHRGNAILAFGTRQVQPMALPVAKTVEVSNTLEIVDRDQLKQKLAAEVQKILAAGHLGPGFVSSGHIDSQLAHECGDDLQDYWHSPSDTIYTLILALPHLSSDLQLSTKTYLQNEFNAYKPYQVTHIGWRDGSLREAFDFPPEVEADRANLGPSAISSFDFEGWGARYGGTNYPPHMFYALWKYAQIFPGQAKEIFDASKSTLSPVPANSILAKYPFVHNSYIAGYWGYLELQKLAGYSESSDIRSELTRLLALRKDTFSKDTSYTSGYCLALSVSRNFMFLVPELADYLHDNALAKIGQAIDEYARIEPYWFVSTFEDTIGESIIQPLYDSNALFQAKALILKEPYQELEKYLDVPAVQVGDLFYIQNLVSAIESHDATTLTPGLTLAHFGVDPGTDNPTTGQVTPARADTFVVVSTAAVTQSIYLPTIIHPLPPASSRVGPVTKLADTVGQYAKFEVAFQITTSAQNMYLPYDPTDLIDGSGITIDMLVMDPGGKTTTVPCFYYQPVDENLSPVGTRDWRCRFAPDSTGTWQYHIRMVDKEGAEQSSPDTFHVIPSNNHGFVRVSSSDTRTFEFSDGTPFLFPLVNVEVGNPLNSLDRIRTNIQKWGQQGVRFVRWFPTGEGANYFVVPFGDDIASSWGFGPAGTVAEGDPYTGQKFTFKPYFYTGQTVSAIPGARYRLSFRARVTGAKVFRPQLGQSVLEIRASDWNDYGIEATSDGDALAIWLHDGYSETDSAWGTIRVHSIRLQRDETGHGGWGPNLLARGDPGTFKYVDQVGAARLDEIMRLSEQYGVYHKVTLFHKNDSILGRLTAEGSVTTSWDINNFYSGEGQAVSRYEKAYARYFVARWSYSTALHSVELANENMLTQNSYDAAFRILGYVRSVSPRHVLLSNSFWGYFVDSFWADPSHGGLMDYADKHWYARPESGDEDLVSTVAYDSAANVRQCQRRFSDYERWYHLNKPIVRGETGVWQSGGYEQIALGTGAFTYYHKQLWAQMGDQCAGEWYTSLLDEQNLWGMYGIYERFLQGEPLSNGHYASVGTDTGTIATTNVSGNIRAWGKVDLQGRGILWIDNADDTWKSVADGKPVVSVSATLTLDDLSNGTYDIQWHNTTTGAVITDTQVISNGTLVLNVSDLQHDVAVKWSKK